MKETIEFTRLLDRVNNSVKKLPARAAVVAVNFSKQRFVSQNWINYTTEPWKKRNHSSWRKQNDKGRAILVKTARLKRSVRTTSVTDSHAVIGTDVPYAAVLNFGFRGRVTQQVRKHTRSTRAGGRSTVIAHSRTINQNIPRRQFIGASNVLTTQITRMMTTEISKAIK